MTVPCYARVVSSPHGPLRLLSNGHTLTRIEFPGRHSDEGKQEVCDAVLDQAERELQQYFHGTRQEFEVPVDLTNTEKGTAFQRSVWKQLCRIPYGTVCSYKDVAVGIGNACAVRAVGSANSKNPIPIIVPCHRVIGSDGTIGGFAGGVDLKERLLESEGVSFEKTSCKRNGGQ